MGILDGLVGLRAYLDANFFIYLAEGFAPVSVAVARIAAMIGAGELAAFTSELTLGETLSSPIAMATRRSSASIPTSFHPATA